MRAPLRLGLYGLVLVVVFTVSGFTANAVISDETVQNWTEESGDDTHDGHGGSEQMSSATATGEHEDHAVGTDSLGLASAQEGYQLTTVNAPTETGTEGEVSFVVTGPDGDPVTDFDVDHEMDMHLIVVRSDGQDFRHVHPEMDAQGTWSIPWEWETAGTYQVFADFVPSGTGKGLTLSTAVQVAGDYAPTPAAEPITHTSVEDFDVSVEGDLIAGQSSELTMSITREGEPVTDLEPYLGAYGHLVALREGDLAYLHVHPHGEEPETGETSGPNITFMTTAPTDGRYLLYLDFKVENEVHTAQLVLDATKAGHDGADSSAEEDSDSLDSGHDHEEDDDHGH